MFPRTNDATERRLLCVTHHDLVWFDKLFVSGYFNFDWTKIIEN